jgi:hypothetical protein
LLTAAWLSWLFKINHINKQLKYLQYFFNNLI